MILYWLVASHCADCYTRKCTWCEYHDAEIELRVVLSLRQPVGAVLGPALSQEALIDSRLYAIDPDGRVRWKGPDEQA